jgi:hypothetical protein
MTLRTLTAVVGSLLLLSPVFPSLAHAQEWAQEIEIITTVGYGDPLHVFVDSLNDALSRNPDAQVKRFPRAETTVSFAELQNELLADGLDLNSVSHAFIRYRFELGPDSEIIETIEEMYFILRVREDRSDLSVLHVSTRDPVVNTLIRDKGIPSPVNMKAVQPFRNMLAFPYLNARQETAMVEIAGRAVRDETPQHQQFLIDFLTDRMMLGMGSYVLDMPRPSVAQVAATSAPAQ